MLNSSVGFKQTRLRQIERKRAMQKVLENDKSSATLFHILARSDAFWILAITALLYVANYNVQKGYLAAFGVGQIFVESSIDSLLVTTSIVLGITFIVWSLLGLLPTKLVTLLFALIYFWLPGLIVLFLLYLAHAIYGYAWGVVFTAIILIPLLLRTAYRTLRKLAFGDFWGDFLEEVRLGVDLEDKTLRGVVITRLPNEFYVLLMLFVLVSQVAGPLLGEYAANRQNDFHTLQFEQGEHIMVSRYKDGWVTVGLSEYSPETGSTVLNGQSRWVSASDLSTREIELRNIRLEDPADEPEAQKNPSTVTIRLPTSDRITFDEFVERLQSWVR